MSSIGFARNVEIIALSFGEAFQKGSNDLIVVRSGLMIARLIIRRIVGIGKAHTRWLLNVQHIGHLVPRIGIGRQLQVLINKKRTMFSCQANQT